MENPSIINRINTTVKIFNSCAVIYHDIRYIGNLNNADKEIIENSCFLDRQIDLEWRLLIIDLKKIFSKTESEYYSIYKLLNYLLSNYKKIKWENTLTIDELKQYLIELEATEMINAEKALKEIRDKAVAHEDKNGLSHDYKISVHQIELLMNYGHRVINKIYYAIDNAQCEFNHFTYCSLESMVQAIAELKEENQKKNE